MIGHERSLKDIMISDGKIKEKGKDLNYNISPDNQGFKTLREVEALISDRVKRRRVVTSNQSSN